MLERIQDKTRGRWRSILPAVGINDRFLTGKHSACPLCGGKDRFRWTDRDGLGGYICNQCGPGSGVDLVMKALKVPFAEAKRVIEQHLPSTTVAMPKAVRDRAGASSIDTWRRSHKLDGRDPASRYLASRGLTFDVYPSQLRFLPNATYWHEDKTRTPHPAMIANFVAPDAGSSTTHTTYLTGEGRKANVPSVRKLAPGPLPKGGAIRLAPSAETMGVAEGIETALSAMRLFDLPVWSCLSTSGLVNWQPPPTCKCVVIFGDSDASFAGQHKAYSLAARLKIEGLHVDVKLPPDVDTDWNDVLMAEQRAM